MSLTVNNVVQVSPFLWRTAEDNSHVLKCTATLTYEFTRFGVINTARVIFYGEAVTGHGFRCDGLSVPWAFRWFLPSWDKRNQLYNVAGAFHDWLYATKGNFGMFCREECDDTFRGLLRESGISRFKAGCADKAIEWFAGGKDHWGNDGYGIKTLARMEITPCSR